MAVVVEKCTAMEPQLTKVETNENVTVFSPELLGIYYSRLFPFEMMYAWLSYDPSTVMTLQSQSSKGEVFSKKKAGTLFTNREFSFTIEPFPGEEIYIRYQSFSTVDELRASIVKRNPIKIDIGAVYSHSPRDKGSIDKSKFVTSQRELIFDIDLTDYDSVRLCGCSAASICHKCWKMAVFAIKVMDQGLREDFGFKHVAWFYSGRRGVHCWVADEQARQLSNEGRSAVADYFQVLHLGLLAPSMGEISICGFLTIY
jgi:DNA primase small subunit